MDALKLIAQDSLKAEVPAVEVGDTVRVHVKIREGDKERIQVFEGTVIARKAQAFPRLSPFAAFLTALALKGYSPFIPPTLPRLRRSDTAVFAEASFITSETESVRLQRSRNRSDKQSEGCNSFAVVTPFLHFLAKGAR